MPSLRVVAVLLAVASLVLFLWAWYRGRSHSASPIPALWPALVPIAILVGTVPALLWPGATQIATTASILSIVLSVVAIVIATRQIWHQWHSERPL